MYYQGHAHAHELKYTIRRKEMKCFDMHRTNTSNYKKRNGCVCTFNIPGTRATHSQMRESCHVKDPWILMGWFDDKFSRESDRYATGVASVELTISARAVRRLQRLRTCYCQTEVVAFCDEISYPSSRISVLITS